MKTNNFDLVSRIKEPTPKWFKIIRSAGLLLSAVGGVLIASPVALPTALVSIVGICFWVELSPVQFPKRQSARKNSEKILLKIKTINR